MEWETIIEGANSDLTQRLNVPGGWLMCRSSGIHLPYSLTSWFVNDPDHTWKIEKDSKLDLLAQFVKLQNNDESLWVESKTPIEALLQKALTQLELLVESGTIDDIKQAIENYNEKFSKKFMADDKTATY